MRTRIPIVYLVDSAGVNLPYQGGVFPGQYGAARIFYYNSLMRRYLRVPQISAVMGPCIAGGAYLPALSDVIFMVQGTSFMGLGGPNLVKGATGQTVDSETLGGADTHTKISGVAHYEAPDDEACLRDIRDYLSDLPRERGLEIDIAEPRPPEHPPEEIYELVPDDHRQAYDMKDVLKRVVDEGEDYGGCVIGSGCGLILTVPDGPRAEASAPPGRAAGWRSRQRASRAAASPHGPSSRVSSSGAGQGCPGKSRSSCRSPACLSCGIPRRQDRSRGSSSAYHA